MMEGLYRVFQWLDYEQAKDFLTRLTGVPIDTDAMYQLIEEGGLPTWCDMTFQCGINDAEPEEYFYPPERYVKVTCYQHGVIYFTNEEGEQVVVASDEGSSPPWETAVWRFKPADIEALAAQIIDLKAPKESPALTNEPSPKSRNAYLRTIAALGYALIGGSTGKPHTDAVAILAALASEGVEEPLGSEALASYLKQAESV